MGSSSLIIKENGKYILRAKEGDYTIGWDAGAKTDRVITTKPWEDNQIFYKIKKWIGCVALNQQFLEFAKAEGKKEVWVNYKMGDKGGRILMDIETWLREGQPWHNPVKPYDDQLVLPRKYLVPALDTIGKEIYDQIWKQCGAEIIQTVKLDSQNFVPIKKEDLDKWMGNAPDAPDGI